MRRFTQNFITNFSNLKRSNPNNLSIKFTKRPILTYNFINKLKYQFSNQNLSSREIDIKISEQRWKNLQHNFKSLKTSFGLIVPTNIPKQYPTPQKIQFTLESLRECSNNYPQYLLEQLKNQQSKFSKVIDTTLGNLWRAEKKQALEFIQFVVHWGIHLRNEEIGEILLRTIKKMELTMFEIFQLLKMMFVISQKYLLEKQKLYDLSVSVKGKGQQSLVGDKKGETIPISGKPIIGNLIKPTNITQCMDNIFEKLLVICENKIILRLQVMNPQQYEPLFKIINMLRHYDIYPQAKVQTTSHSKSNKQGKSQQQQKQQQQQQKQQKQQQKEVDFFDIIQHNLFKNLTEIPPSSLVIMAVHYANNTKQDQDNRINILSRLQQRILFNLKFFNHQQLIAILYSYMRTSMMGKQFRQQAVSRIRLIYHQLSWANKKKILALSSNFPQHEKILIISQAQSQLLRGKPVVTKMDDGTVKKQFDPKIFIQPDYQLVPEIYLASYENNLMTEQLCKRMQHIILQNIYNYDRQQVVRSVWLFTVTPSISDNLQRLHKKLQVIIQGGFQGGQYTIKDISILVWSLCNSGSRNQSVYRVQAQFWNNIEFYLQEKLQKSSLQSSSGDINNRLSDVSSILWAFTFNRPLKFKTVSMITEILLQEMVDVNKISNSNKTDKINNTTNQQQPTNNMQSFQLINIITFYYSLPNKSLPTSLLNKIKLLSLQYFQSLYKQMNSLQLMKCLKYLSDQQRQTDKLVLKIKVWQNIIQIFTMEINQIDYQHIMGVVGLVVDSPLGRAKDRGVVELVGKLLLRKKSLQQLKSVQERLKQSTN